MALQLHYTLCIITALGPVSPHAIPIYVSIKPPRHRFGFSLAWGWQLKLRCFQQYTFPVFNQNIKANISIHMNVRITKTILLSSAHNEQKKGVKTELVE